MRCFNQQAVLRRHALEERLRGRGSRRPGITLKAERTTQEPGPCVGRRAHRAAGLGLAGVFRRHRRGVLLEIGLFSGARSPRPTTSAELTSAANVPSIQCLFMIFPSTGALFKDWTYTDPLPGQISEQVGQRFTMHHIILLCRNNYQFD